MARPDGGIKLVARTFTAFPLVLCLAITACDFRQVSTGPELPGGLPEHQLRKQEILDEFYENPEAAKLAYRKQWEDGQVERAKDESVAANVIWLPLAGILIEHDTANYADYYSYIVPRLHSNDWEVASTAVSALRGARGRESIDHIIRMLKDKRELVSAGAALAIDYRLKSSLYDSSLKSDYLYAMAQMKNICSDPRSVRGLERVCRENGLIR